MGIEDHSIRAPEAPAYVQRGDLIARGRFQVEELRPFQQVLVDRGCRHVLRHVRIYA